MSLYPKTDGTWGVEWRDEWGRRKKKPVGTREAATLVEEQLRLSAAADRRTLRTFQAGERISLAQARDIYLANLRATEYTKHHMRERLELFERYLGQSALAQVTPQLCTRWLERRRPMLSLQTLWRDVKMLRTWFDWLKAEGYAMSNPLAQLHVPKPTETRARAITYEEERRLLEALQPSTRLRCQLALDAGMSLGEIQTLRKNHIDFAARTLTTFRAKTRRWRTIPLTHRLDRELHAQLTNALPDALITSRAGRPLKPNSANKFMPRARQVVGTSFRFHDLRHTFASRIAASGANVFVIAALLGHSVPRSSMNREGKPILSTTAEYVHPSLEELRSAVEAMERANPNTQPEREQKP